MSVAKTLNGLREQQADLAETIKRETADNANRKELADGNGDRLARRADDLRVARKMMRDSVTAWEAARTALIDNDDEAAATRHAGEALSSFNQAYEVVHGRQPVAAPDDKAKAAPEPVKGPGEKPAAEPVLPVKTGDDTLEPPVPAPSVPEPVKVKEGKKAAAPAAPAIDSDEEPAWAKKLAGSLTGALQQHTEGCDRQFEELRKGLEELTANSLSAEHVAVLKGMSPQELDAALKAAGVAQDLKQSLDGIDLKVLTEILALFKDDEYSVDDLKTALSGGRFINGKRWNRNT